AHALHDCFDSLIINGDICSGQRFDERHAITRKRVKTDRLLPISSLLQPVFSQSISQVFNHKPVSETKADLVVSLTAPHSFTEDHFSCRVWLLL
ncbi:unnamed protein product, partial [Musa banksii]